MSSTMRKRSVQENEPKRSPNVLFALHEVVQTVIIFGDKKEQWIDARICEIHDNEDTYDLNVLEPDRHKVTPYAVHVPAGFIRKVRSPSARSLESRRSDFSVGEMIETRIVYGRRQSELWIAAKVLDYNEDDESYDIQVMDPEKHQVVPKAIHVPRSHIRRPPPPNLVLPKNPVVLIQSCLRAIHELDQFETFEIVVVLRGAFEVRLKIRPTTKVGDIKQEIELKYRFTAEGHCLICNGRLLEDDRSLQDYQLGPGKKFSLVRRSWAQKFAHTPSRTRALYMDTVFSFLDFAFLFSDHDQRSKKEDLLLVLGYNFEFLGRLFLSLNEYRDPARTSRTFLSHPLFANHDRERLRECFFHEIPKSDSPRFCRFANFLTSIAKLAAVFLPPHRNPIEPLMNVLKSMFPFFDFDTSSYSPMFLPFADSFDRIFTNFSEYEALNESQYNFLINELTSDDADGAERFEPFVTNAEVVFWGSCDYLAPSGKLVMNRKQFQSSIVRLAICAYDDKKTADATVSNTKQQESGSTVSTSHLLEFLKRMHHYAQQLPSDLCFDMCSE